MPFNDNVAESRKVAEFKKMDSTGMFHLYFRLDFSKFCPEWPHSKCEDGSQEEVS